MNEQKVSKVIPLYRRFDSNADCYRKETVGAMRAVQTPAAPFIPFIPFKLNPPIPREEE